MFTLWQFPKEKIPWGRYLIKKYTDVPNKEIAYLYEIGSSMVINALSGRYKENNFMIKSSMKIEKNVKL